MEYAHQSSSSSSSLVGVYRLLFSVTNTTTTNTDDEYTTTTTTTTTDDSTGKEYTTSTVTSNLTACIPYTATADQLTDILSALPLIQSYGGVRVRVTGSDSDPRFNYGFSYRLEFDAVHTHKYLGGGGGGALSAVVACYGIIDCDCAETKVLLQDDTGTLECETAANYSMVDAFACVHTPTITIQPVTRLSYLGTTGHGSILCEAGLHRLPPVSLVSISVLSGVGIVVGDEVSWSGMEVGGTGQLISGGTGWEGWDSAFLLFAPDWTNERGLVALQSAPASNMMVSSFLIRDLGGFFCSGPNSNYTWESGSWAGGIIGGRAHWTISGSLVINGTTTVLRDVATILFNASASVSWITGNVSLANGATLVNEARFFIAYDSDTSSTTTSTNRAMGESEYLNETRSPELLLIHPGRSWQSYYSETLVKELRSGWYTNPDCGLFCAATNLFITQGDGELVTQPNATAYFLLPVFITGRARVNLDVASSLVFESGGGFGDDVVFTLGEQVLLALTGGQMSMGAGCTIQGAGELRVSGGYHDLSFIVDAHITIAGGALAWPESRGIGKTISFRGGLLIEGNGRLVVEPQSTTIAVDADVIFRDNAFVQFPVLGIATQSTPFDGLDFPDTSPRCTLNASKVMRWEGGTIAGKVDIISLQFLYLDGDAKYIQSLAKLLNYGHCEWGSGNLIIANNGDFVNYGTLQMMNGVALFDASVYYLGTALPVANGGDPLAKEFHTFDQDPGALDFSEYVRLNGQFVSILPDGWTSEDQK
jgi:hypothetical protein